MFGKVLIIFVLVVVLLGGGIGLIESRRSTEQVVVPPTNMATTSVTESTTSGKIKPFDFENKSFKIDDQDLAFYNGKFANNEASHSATIEKKATSPDGMHSAAVIIDQPGGSGTFYYLVGAYIQNGTEMYSEPMLLGDRIQFQKVEVLDPGAQDNGEIIVTYLDHGPRDPMSTPPKKQTEKKYSFEDNGNLIEVLH